MKRKFAGEPRIINLVTLISYAFGDHRHHAFAERFFDKAEKEEFKIYLLDVTTIEAEMLFLSGKVRVSFSEWRNFIETVLRHPLLDKIILSSEIFGEHAKLYKGYGGRFTYFDSFHAAAAKTLAIKLVTTDDDLLKDKEIPTEDLRSY